MLLGLELIEMDVYVKSQECVCVRLERNKRDGEERHTNAGVGTPTRSSTPILRGDSTNDSADTTDMEPGLCHTGPCALYRICPIAHTLNSTLRLYLPVLGPAHQVHQICIYRTWRPFACSLTG